MASTDIKALIKRNDYLQGTRGDWLSYWQDVANFCLPRKAWITTMQYSGARLKFNFLYDSRAILALKKSAAGFHSNLTNPASKWFSFRTLDEKYMQSGNVQRYFKDVDDIQYSVINNSNHNETMLEYYTDDLCFGSTCILTEEDYKTHVRYTSVPLEQINVELDERGDLLAIYRNFKYTVDQCIGKFGENNITPEMRQAKTDGKSYQKFDIMHYVAPRYERDVSKKDNVNMAYRSCWVAKKEMMALAEGGFTSNPYEFERFWVHAEDTFGYGPAMDVLASIKLANAQKRTIIRKAMKDADPATMAPARFWLAPLNLNPQAMNYYDKTKYTKDDFGAIGGGGNPTIAIEMMQLEESIIDQGFYLPLFESLANVTKQMTVPEVQRKVAENLALIGPVVGRMIKGISRTQLRTFEILDRRLLFPPAPKEIQGQDLNLVFLSPLAKAQRASEMNGLMTWLQLIQGVAGLIPDITDKVNADRVADGAADLLGVDPSYVREQKQVDQIRAKNAQIKQQMMQMQMVGQAAETAKTGAEAQKAHAEASTK